MREGGRREGDDLMMMMMMMGFLGGWRWVGILGEGTVEVLRWRSRCRVKFPVNLRNAYIYLFL